MAATEDDIRESFARAFTNERLALELTMILETGQKPAWRKAVMAEASSRLIDLDAQVQGVMAALTQLEADYAARKHGGVAQDQALRKIKVATGLIEE